MKIDDIILKEFGFDSSDDFMNNFIESNDYIELKTPMKGIKAIQKGLSKKLNWQSAEQYAKELILGEHYDWQIPFAEQLLCIQLINDILDYKLKGKGLFWSKTNVIEHGHGVAIHVYSDTYRVLFDNKMNQYVGALVESEKTYRNGVDDEGKPQWLFVYEDYNEDLLCNVRCVRIATSYNSRRFSYQDCPKLIEK